MKKLLYLLLLAVALLVSCTSMTEAEKKAKNYDRYISKGFSEEDAEILSMTDQERLEYLCPFYDLPVDKREYSYKDRFFMNTIYSFIVGDYGTTIPSGDKDTVKSVIRLHGDIVSFYINERIQVYDYSSTIGRESPMFSDTELFLRQVKALRLIEEIHNEMRESGALHDGMSELEKAKACTKWISKNIGTNTKNAIGSSFGGRPGVLQAEDSIYNCVTKKTVACGPRASVMTILLHLEGIKAHTIGVVRFVPERNGHIMTRAILDGKEYWIDWQHEPMSIRTPEEWKASSKWELNTDAYSILF